MGYQLYFVSGENSTTPITGDTDGFIGSTQSATTWNISGNHGWSGLKDTRTYKWHAYLKSGNQWSKKSAVREFYVDIPSEDHPDTYNVFYTTYRNGQNDAGLPMNYRIMSGATFASSYEITLIKGKSNTECPYPGYTITGPDKKLWIFMDGWKDSALSQDGAGCALYTYAASLQSHCNKYDYWFYPKGTCAASSSKFKNADITYDMISANNAGPQVKHLHDSAFGVASYTLFGVMPNGDLAAAAYSAAGYYPQKFWVYSSQNNTWYNTFSHSGNFLTDWTAHEICCASTMAGYFYASGNKLMGYSTNDNGRSWFKKSGVVDTFTDPDTGPGEGRKIYAILGVDPIDWNHGGKFYGEYPDNYARFIVSRNPNLGTDPYFQYKSGSYYIYKVNLNNYADYSKRKIYPSGVGHDMKFGIKSKGSHGMYTSGLSIFPVCIWQDETVYNKGKEGDPRAFAWWNEVANTSGIRQYDTTHGTLDTSHAAGCVGIDRNGLIWAGGAGYHGTNDGDSAYEGYVLNFSILSGTTNPSDPLVMRFHNIDNSGGGIGGNLIILSGACDS